MDLPREIATRKILKPWDGRTGSPQELGVGTRDAATAFSSLRLGAQQACAAGCFPTSCTASGGIHLGGVYLLLHKYLTLLILTLCGMAAPLFYAGLPDPVPAEKSKRHWLHVHRQEENEPQINTAEITKVPL